MAGNCGAEKVCRLALRIVLDFFSQEPACGLSKGKFKEMYRHFLQTLVVMVAKTEALQTVRKCDIVQTLIEMQIKHWPSRQKATPATAWILSAKNRGNEQISWMDGDSKMATMIDKLLRGHTWRTVPCATLQHRTSSPLHVRGGCPLRRLMLLCPCWSHPGPSTRTRLHNRNQGWSWGPAKHGKPNRFHRKDRKNRKRRHRWTVHMRQQDMPMTLTAAFAAPHGCQDNYLDSQLPVCGQHHQTSNRVSIATWLNGNETKIVIDCQSIQAENCIPNVTNWSLITSTSSGSSTSKWQV